MKNAVVRLSFINKSFLSQKRCSKFEASRHDSIESLGRHAHLYKREKCAKFYISFSPHVRKCSKCGLNNISFV